MICITNFVTRITLKFRFSIKKPPILLHLGFQFLLVFKSDTIHWRKFNFKVGQWLIGGNSKSIAKFGNLRNLRKACCQTSHSLDWCLLDTTVHWPLPNRLFEFLCWIGQVSYLAHLTINSVNLADQKPSVAEGLFESGHEKEIYIWLLHHPNSLLVKTGIFLVRHL